MFLEFLVRAEENVFFCKKTLISHHKALCSLYDDNMMIVMAIIAGAHELLRYHYYSVTYHARSSKWTRSGGERKKTKSAIAHIATGTRLLPTFLYHHISHFQRYDTFISSSQLRSASHHKVSRKSTIEKKKKSGFALNLFWRDRVSLNCSMLLLSCAKIIMSFLLNETIVFRWAGRNYLGMINLQDNSRFSHESFKCFRVEYEEKNYCIKPVIRCV